MPATAIQRVEGLVNQMEALSTDLALEEHLHHEDDPSGVVGDPGWLADLAGAERMCQDLCQVSLCGWPHPECNPGWPLLTLAGSHAAYR